MLSEKSVAAIRKGVEYLREEMRRVNMKQGVSSFKSINFDDFETVPEELEPPCGTVCCIAGAMVLAHGWIKFNPEKDWRMAWAEVSLKARDNAELTREQANRLFLFKNMTCYGHEEDWHWPAVNEAEYNLADTPEKKFAAVEKRVELFISSGGTI